MNLRMVKAARWPRWPSWAPVVAAGWLALVAAGVVLSRLHHRDVPMCVFKNITGVPCPTCGSTRGCLAALHGHLIVAWRYNPLVMTAGLAAAAVLLARLLLGRKLEIGLSRSEKKAAWAMFILAVALNWLYVIEYVG